MKLKKSIKTDVARCACVCVCECLVWLAAVWGKQHLYVFLGIWMGYFTLNISALLGRNDLRFRRDVVCFCFLCTIEKGEHEYESIVGGWQIQNVCETIHDKSACQSRIYSFGVRDNCKAHTADLCVLLSRPLQPLQQTKKPLSWGFFAKLFCWKKNKTSVKKEKIMCIRNFNETKKY